MAGVGIFGGTFDPIHLGHLRSAYEVTQQLSLDKLYFVPNAQTVHRHQPNTDFLHRLQMVKLAIADVHQWQSSACEGERSGASYTYHTIQHFRELLDDDKPLWLIIGSDAFYHFHTWHRWQEILSLCQLAVMTRAGETVTGGCAKTQALLTNNQEYAIGRVLPVTVTALDISSSKIRAELLAQQSPRFLLPETVLTYIQKNELYTPPTGLLDHYILK